MSEQLAFGRLVAGLSPWLGQLVFVGGWAFRLYRLHPGAEVPLYRPVVTLDADVAFAEGERLEGNIRARLLDTGFVENLMGNHRPPVSQYTLGDDASGFYAEFLTPLTGSGRRRDGEPMATVARAGVTAQLGQYGVQTSQDDRCTAESAQLYSYRRDGRTGRQALTILRRVA